MGDSGKSAKYFEYIASSQRNHHQHGCVGMVAFREQNLNFQSLLYLILVTNNKGMENPVIDILCKFPGVKKTFVGDL